MTLVFNPVILAKILLIESAALPQYPFDSQMRYIVAV
jgi:hypothetical protein